MSYMIVEPNAIGGWDVRRSDNRTHSYRTSSRAGAEAWVRLAGPPGGDVVVHDFTGRTIAQFTVGGKLPAAGAAETVAAPKPADAAPSPPPSYQDRKEPGLVEQIDSEGEGWDHVIDFGVPILGAAGSAFVSPEVAAADSWIAVFFATLTWSLGVGLSTFVLTSQKLVGPSAGGAITLCMLVALGFANWLGVGVLDVGPALAETSGHPLLRIPLAFFVTALATYGIGGTILGGLIGVWLGHRVGKRFVSTT